MDTPSLNDPGAELERLERALRELLALCERLRNENERLRRDRQALAAERAALLEKNEQARRRVEAVIERLKEMENAP